MLWVKSAAEAVRANRRQAGAENPFIKAEREASNRIEASLDQFRDKRDAFSEQAFKAVYESPGLAALVGLNWRPRLSATPPHPRGSVRSSRG